MGSSGMPFIEAGRETIGSGTEVGNAGVLELGWLGYGCLGGMIWG
jgi:hypothetical protein